MISTLTAGCPLRPRGSTWATQVYTGGNDELFITWVCLVAPRPREATVRISPCSAFGDATWVGGRERTVRAFIQGKLASAGDQASPGDSWLLHGTPWGLHSS